MPGAADETPAASGAAAGHGGPTNLVVLLLDSLNRHMLGSYGGTEFDTPNLEADMVELLRVALQTVQAPEEQLQRLGLA